MDRFKRGVIPSGRTRHFSLRASDQLYHPDVDWNSVVLPPDFQNEGSCVARATCNAIECFLRIRGVTFEPGTQLDAERLYWTARKLYYGSEWMSDNGLQLDEAAKAAKALNWIPASTNIVEIEPNVTAIVNALHNGPLIQAHLVGSNWEKVTEQGEIPYSLVTPANSAGGHCTLGISYRYREGTHLIGLQNSWDNWGINGSQAFMSLDTWWAGFRWINDGPFLLYFDQKDWATHEGYKEGLVCVGKSRAKNVVP